MFQVSGAGSVFEETVVQLALAARVREELGAVPEQPARREPEVEAHGTLVRRPHREEFGPPAPHLLHHHADHAGRDLDHGLLVRLEDLPVRSLAQDDAGARHGELVPLPAHGFHEDREVEFPAARNREGVGGVGGLDAKGDVPLQFPEEALAQLPGRHVLARPSGEGGVVDPEVHRERGPFDGDPAETVPAVGVRDRLADLHAFESRQRHDVAGARAGRFDPLQPVEAVDLEHPGRERLVRGHRSGLPERQQHHAVRLGHRAALDAADRDASHVAGVIQRRGEHLERSLGVAGGGGDRRHDRLEQRLQVSAARLAVRRRPAVPRARVEERGVELGFGGVQLHEQLQHIVVYFGGALVGPVHLVDHHHGREPQGEGLPRDEARLRHGPLGRVHQEKHAVHHPEDALDLPAEVGMAGVSTMLILVSPQRTAVFFDRIVMPRSRSSGLESMTRSSTRSCDWKAPACRSMWSTSVVFP